MHGSAEGAVQPVLKSRDGQARSGCVPAKALPLRDGNGRELEIMFYRYSGINEGMRMFNIFFECVPLTVKFSDIGIIVIKKLLI